MRTKKSLGQNFLQSAEVVRDIVATAEIKAGETVLEVGPGQGVLTQALLEAGAKVMAVEKDARLIGTLKKKFPGAQIIHADILNYPLPVTRYKLVANIPYYITGKFLRKIFSAEHLPARVVLLLQKEVAERIVGSTSLTTSGAKTKESLLSISVKAYGTPGIARYVGRENFEPEPKVDSAVLLIEKISRNFFAAIDQRQFFSLVRKGFAGKRKQIGKKFNLAGDKRRAEELTLSDWRELYNKL